jgi:branched-chain amino acid transport system permease protein
VSVARVIAQEPSRSHRSARFAPRRLGAVAAIGLAAVLAFVSSEYVLSELTLVVAYAVATLGLNLLIGYGGQISLGHGAFFALGAYVTAILIGKHVVPALATIPIAAGVTFCAGYLFGLPALRLRGIYLGLVTLTLAVAAQPLLNRFTITGGSDGLTVSQPQPPVWLGISQVQFVYLLCLVVAALLFLAARGLVRSQVGRSLLAVNDNELAAGAVGVHVARAKIGVFAWSAMYAGIGGTLYVFSVGFVSPDSFTLTLSVWFLAAVVLGGRRSIAGALVGGLFIEFLPVYAAKVDEALTGAIYGVALIACVYLMPDGAVGLARRLAHRVLATVRAARSRATALDVSHPQRRDQ